MELQKYTYSSVHISSTCSVSLCGYWMLPPALQLPLDPTLVSVIEGTTLPLLYVGFGSMEKFILDVNWEDIFEILESGVHALAQGLGG